MFLTQERPEMDYVERGKNFLCKEKILSSWTFSPIFGYNIKKKKNLNRYPCKNFTK